MPYSALLSKEPAILPWIQLTNAAMTPQGNQPKPNQCEPQYVPTLGHEAMEQVQANLQRIVSGQLHAAAITVRTHLPVSQAPAEARF